MWQNCYILLDDTFLIVLILNYTQKGRASCKYGLISRLVVAMRYFRWTHYKLCTHKGHLYILCSSCNLVVLLCFARMRVKASY
jgi:hypothetical protein